MKRFSTRLPGSVTKTRLDHYLSEWLPHAYGKPISRTLIRTLIISGSVYVNRHRNKVASTPLFSGAMIEVYLDEDRLFQNQPRKIEDVRIDGNQVVFEDEWLMIINKPSGLPTQPTVDPNRPNLYDLLKKHLDQREQKQGSYVGLHHRLDKDTSGLILFTKKEEANKGVADLFQNHKLQKSYQCLVWKSPSGRVISPGETFTLKNNLALVGERKGRSYFGEVRSGGDVAITHFRGVEIFRDAYWLEAKPETGRTHQIRVHCAGMNLPILGDDLYFPEGVLSFINAPRLMLHSSKVEFLHPITKAQVKVECPIPEEFVQVLGGLKS